MCFLVTVKRSNLVTQGSFSANNMPLLLNLTMSKPPTAFCDTTTNYYQPEFTPELHGHCSRVPEPTASHQLFTDSLLASLASSEAYRSNEVPNCISKKAEKL